MILKNNSEDVKVLVKYFESLGIENRLKLSIIVIQSDLIKLKIDKEKLVDILKNFLCIFDQNYNKNAMISYKDNMNVFILAKVMEMNEKERNNFVFDILHNIREYLNKIDFLCKIIYNNIIICSVRKDIKILEDSLWD